MTVRIEKIADSDLKERLMTMGFIPGTKVKVLRPAPMGDPMAFGIRGYNVAMRLADADLSVALTGNPNTGKSTIFNELTGARQKIGNWPGVTVDKKVGYTKLEDCSITVVDLPGTYSVNARSPEEKIVIDYLLQNPSDVDEAQKRGVVVDREKLQNILGYPVTEAVGRSSQSVERLKVTFTKTRMQEYKPSERLQSYIESIKEVEAGSGTADEKTEQIIKMRYAFIDEIVAEAVVITNTGETVSEKADRFLANGVLALPIFLAIMYAVFQITFEWIGQPIADALDEFIGGDFTDMVAEALESAEVADWMQSLILDGIIGGVGSVIIFVPLIFILFFCLSFLDGTGYMARVAFIMDPIMRRVGLTGKGVMPLIVGFGCGVPSIMGARALDSEKDRMLSIMASPFLTCGAKLPIMALFAAMFFPDNAANVVFAMYIVGVVMAIASSKLLGSTVFKDGGSTFLLELPPYRFPDMKTVIAGNLGEGQGVLSAFGSDGMVEDMADSYLATIGGVVGALFTFHGFGTWEAGAAAISGILAKESVVSTIGVLYGLADVSAEAEDAVETAEALMETGMAASFTTMSALAFMVFSQLYTPCVTALGTIKKEAGHIKWMVFAGVYMFAVAWVVSLIVYQAGTALGF
ncbi:unnamed protein product [Cylicocyclus nassatus]|uniref:FeoB-type G domain-containing protein n=1 Tax=Cylicocyclus nassatus TaxID=53992 RepID=A0AA36GZ55_CYLNA|nr:unnamed protein product [Cylicocyclus nassatus]